MDIKRLEAKDYEEATDLLNLVFSTAYGPTNFPKMLPLLYRPTDEHMRDNFAVVENGRIRAIVGLFHSQIVAGDVVLKLGGIGGVSSHPNDRGKGWMKLLMSRCVEEMQLENLDLSFLTGYRQRYMNYGYEKSGSLLEYRIIKYNFSHFKGDASAPALQFRRIQQTDLQYLEQAKALHDLQPFHCSRSLSDFYLYLLSMNAQPWVALYPDGHMAGYLTANDKHTSITEIFAENSTAISGMIRSWFSQQNIEEARISLPLWEQETARYLGSFADDMNILGNGSWRIFNWDKVVETLLRLKSDLCPLEDGILRIGIKAYGTITLSVHEGRAACKKTTDQPDIEWNSLVATRVLFGHIPAGFVVTIPQTLQALISSWFPLPLSWLPQNYV